MRMGIEIERKFLVKNNPDFANRKCIGIIQAYLSASTDMIVRIRIAGDEGFLTVKTCSIKGNIGRCEWEYSIPVQDAHEMIRMCKPGKIEKTRYYVPFGRHTWEVDVFHGLNEGLIVAEIELDNESDTFEKPEWLGEEVTGRPEYYNSNLIKQKP